MHSHAKPVAYTEDNTIAVSWCSALFLVQTKWWTQFAYHSWQQGDLHNKFWLQKIMFFFHDVSCVLTLADFYWPGCAQGNIGGRSALWLLRMDWKGKILTGDVSRVPSSKFVKKATICWITVCLFFIPVRIIFNGPPLLRTLSVLLICILFCERRVLTEYSWKLSPSLKHRNAYPTDVTFRVFFPYW